MSFAGDMGAAGVPDHVEAFGEAMVYVAAGGAETSFTGIVDRSGGETQDGDGGVSTYTRISVRVASDALTPAQGASVRFSGNNDRYRIAGVPALHQGMWMFPAVLAARGMVK